MTDPVRRTVLVGVDGSEDGLRAVRYAVRAAMVDDADLRLVHAVDDAVLAGAWGVVYDPTILQTAGEQANAAAVELAAELGFPPERTHAEVVLGNASAVLAKFSKDAILLVVGRRSVSGLERMFVGSTSVSVAATAHCPVVVISAASTPEPTGQFKRIAVGVEGEAKAERTLTWALEEAERRGAVLEVIDVIKPPQGVEPQVDAARAAIETTLNPLKPSHPSVQVEVRVEIGEPVDKLVERSESVDLMVLGVRPPRVLGFSMGGVDRAVIAHAHCPLALVR